MLGVQLAIKSFLATISQYIMWTTQQMRRGMWTLLHLKRMMTINMLGQVIICSAHLSVISAPFII
jgi:hypothetical protein